MKTEVEIRDYTLTNYLVMMGFVKIEFGNDEE